MALNSSGKVQDSITALSLQAQKSSPASLRASDIKGGKVYSSRELAGNLPLGTPSSSSITLTLSNSEVSEIGLGNGSVFMIYLKTGNQSGVCSMERGGMRDATAVTVVREGCGRQEKSSLVRRAHRVVSSSLPSLPPPHPQHTVRLHNCPGSEQGWGIREEE